MSVKIHIPADEVWSFFFKNKERCIEEMVEIAANDETEYAVYLTEDEGYPMLSVCHGDDEPEYEEGTISKDDCTETAKRMFVRYLFPVTVTCGKTVFQDSIAKNAEPDEEDDSSEQDRLDEIYERDDELTLALCDFLKVVFEEDVDGAELLESYTESVILEILDEFLDCLAANHCFTDIRRPTFITDPETGEEFFTEFPYDPELVYESQMEAYEEDEITTETDGDTE